MGNRDWQRHNRKRKRDDAVKQTIATRFSNHRANKTSDELNKTKK